MLDSLVICKFLSCSCLICISDVSCEPSVVKKIFHSDYPWPLPPCLQLVRKSESCTALVRREDGRAGDRVKKAWSVTITLMVM